MAGENPDATAKKEYGGSCAFLCLFLVSASAFVLNVVSVGYCAFMRREMQLSRPVSDYCNNANVSALIENVTGTTALEPGQCETLLQNHGVGFWGWKADVAVNGTIQPACFSYTQYIPGTPRTFVAVVVRTPDSPR